MLQASGCRALQAMARSHLLLMTDSICTVTTSRITTLHLAHMTSTILVMNQDQGYSMISMGLGALVRSRRSEIMSVGSVWLTTGKSRACVSSPKPSAMKMRHLQLFTTINKTKSIHVHGAHPMTA